MNIEINSLWAYPNQNMEDIEVWEETINGTEFYKVGIEGYIFYDSIEEGIIYYKKMKDEYFNWLKENYDLETLIKNKDNTEKRIYKSYDIEIYKDSMVEGYYTIYLKAPDFNNLYNIYLWLDGVINQIQEQL